VTGDAGCFTTARATGGRVWQARRHADRLVRDARLLGLGELDLDACLHELAELAALTRDGSSTIVRLELRRDDDGSLRLVGSRRAWGDDPPVWRAATSLLAHPGATPTSRVKSTERGLYVAALEAARAAGADDALLFDSAGFLVEGARTNLVVAGADGSLLTPPLARGGVAGVAREVLFDREAALREADLSAADVAGARELIAINAVRGARAVTQLDERPIADARPGPWSQRLARALEDGC
jgi:branched-subunit amino acid aminotransferase/4-amino-4-deoxychorismate lyase